MAHFATALFGHDFEGRAEDHEARIHGYKKAVRLVQTKPEFAAPDRFPWM